jgi:Na+-translocating ferredoxin:NAD+ oxidoreductase RnfG subunit
MRFARGSLIFSYGLFTIAAQSLLFREFLTTFEGNDISVGIFFGSWFLWVGLGATVVYKAGFLGEKLQKVVALLFLCYLPAFVVQMIMIVQARAIAGIEPYALMPVRTILVLSLLVNAPVSLVTGMLFPLACRWFRQVEDSAVSRVYILEAAGSLVGGLAATALLGLGLSVARIFLILALVLNSSVLGVSASGAGQDEPNRRETIYRRIRFFIALVVLLSVAVCTALGVDGRIMRRLRVLKWSRLLPADALGGSFQTPQAEYLYGIRERQWVAMREGGVCEALPDRTTAGRIAALCLCQKADARRVLVIGKGLGVARELLILPQIKQVAWMHPDSEYVRRVTDFIPEDLRITDERFHRPAGDVRSLLGESKQHYDIVILDLPSATNSVLNRYYTLEFYSQVKQALTPGGVVAVRTEGGENIMGTELVNLGASVKLTLEQVFSRTVLTPGDESWFVASDSNDLTGDPAILRDRFERIEGANELFEPEALLSVYLPDRAAAALASYTNADLPERLLINRDSRPLTHLYSLLLASKQSGAPITEVVKLLSVSGPLAFVIPILVLVLLRVVYIWRTRAQPERSGFDSAFLVFSAGWVGIGVVIVLMYLYQTRFGSLYLHVGIISSLFMAGLTAGAASARRLLRALLRQNERGRLLAQSLLFCVIAVHAVILVSIAIGIAGQLSLATETERSLREASHLVFGAAFILCGLCTGCYFPIAAGQLAAFGFETGHAGGKLETADHIGASVGGMVTSLALVPVLGTKAALFVLVLLILANTPFAALRMVKPERISYPNTTALKLRRFGYIIFAIAVCVVLCSNLLAEAAARLRPSLATHTAQALAGEFPIERASSVPAESSRKISYFKVYKTEDKPTGYIFSSEDLAPEVRGFGGRMNLAVYVDASGTLLDFHVTRSNETPAYLRLLGKWLEELKNRPLFRSEPFDDVEAVTGATVSSKAILLALQRSSREFASQILNQPVISEQQGTAHPVGYMPDAASIYLIAAALLAVVVTYYGGFRVRLGVLAINLVIGGIILNTQYSSEQIASLLSVQAPGLRLTGAFLLVAGIPLLVAVIGNVYCGYICPFGAAQELVGQLLPRKLKPSIAANMMLDAGLVKYVVLFIFVMVFFLSRNRTTLVSDPLISVFNLRFSAAHVKSASLLAGAALVFSLFYPRFWCRYVCPAGAFLSLLSRAALLSRLLPAKRFAKCEFGLTAGRHADCIYCDRCRFPSKRMAARTPRLRPEYAAADAASVYFIVAVLAAAALVSTVAVRRFVQVIPVRISRDYPTKPAASGGQPRDVDIERIRTLIQQKKLSDHEAEFYKKLEQD